MILHGVWHASRIVFWTLVVLVLFLYVGAIVMTDQVIKAQDPMLFDYSVSAWQEKPWTAYDYWGTVPKSLLSLFQVVTLDHWASTLIRPLVTERPGFMIFLAPFMSITVLSLLNVIVAVIIETTLASASVNGERVARDDRKAHDKIMNSLKVLFEQADEDDSGELDRDELERAWRHQHVRDRMSVLQLEYKDLTALFDLLDTEGTGNINTTKFFRGCARIRGLASSSDLHHMSIDLNRCIAWADHLVYDHREINNRLNSLLADIEGLDRDIVKGHDDSADPVLMNRRERYHKKMAAGYHRDYEENDSDFSEVWEDGEDSEADKNSNVTDHDLHNTLHGARKSCVATTLLKTDIGFDMNEVREHAHVPLALSKMDGYDEEVHDARNKAKMTWQREGGHKQRRGAQSPDHPLSRDQLGSHHEDHPDSKNSRHRKGEKSKFDD